MHTRMLLHSAGVGEKGYIFTHIHHKKNNELCIHTCTQAFTSVNTHSCTHLCAHTLPVPDKWDRELQAAMKGASSEQLSIYNDYHFVECCTQP